MDAPRLIAVMGPTASGKSSLAETISQDLDAVIINADAFQIYRGLDIGTSKTKDATRYRLIDVRDPDEDFGVGEYVVLAANLLHQLFEEGRSVVICGGTGLYIRALLEEYKDLMPAPSAQLRKQLSLIALEEAVERLLDLSNGAELAVDLKNEVRVKRMLEKLMAGEQPIHFTIPPFRVQKVAIIPSIEISQQKIKQRTEKMFQNGWVAEVKGLLSNGYGPGNPGFRALGYEAIAEYIQNAGNEEVLKERIKSDTVQYAKRQRTWLRAEPNLYVYSETSDALEAIKLSAFG